MKNLRVLRVVQLNTPTAWASIPDFVIVSGSVITRIK